MEEEDIRAEVVRNTRIKAIEDEMHKLENELYQLKSASTALSPQPEPFSPNLGSLQDVHDDAEKLDNTISKLDSWLRTHEGKLPRMSEVRRDFYLGYNDMHKLLRSFRKIMQTIEQDNDRLRRRTLSQPVYYQYVPATPQAGILFGSPPFMPSPGPSKGKGRK